MRMMRLILLLAVSTFVAAQSPAQSPWQMQDSGTTAGLRGIYSVDGTIAWASGTNGTVLKTIDGGAHWTACAIPDADKDGATLDFRGVQAWDAQTAIVMASGPGEKSRLYKTTDGCKKWKLVFRNTDKEGFWDAVQITSPKTALLIGDPLPKVEFSHLRVKKYFHFPLYGTIDSGITWTRLDSNNLFAFSDESGKPTKSIFAASNSSLLETAHHNLILFVSGGKIASLNLLEFIDQPIPLISKSSSSMTGGTNVPLKSGPTAGAFSVAVKDGDSINPTLVVVGGDYSNPENRDGTAAVCAHELKDHPRFMTFFKCEASTIPPHGFRSAVQWSEALKLWITVGTNGSDVSRDDGKTWQPLDNGNWNALSLPFVVGPNGRIARLNPAALSASKN
jgi:hypothetical protein